MPYKDIIEYGSNHGNPTADDVAKHIVDLQNAGKNTFEIFMKLDKGEDGRDDKHRRWDAVGIALNRHFKARAKERRKFKSEYVKSNGDELEAALFVRNPTQLELALKYQYQVLPKILEDFSNHTGSHGKRTHQAKQKQLAELIQYCGDAKNDAYDSLKDIVLVDPLTLPEFKNKIKQVMMFRFMTMGVEGYMINKTNAKKLVDAIFKHMKKVVTNDDEFEFKNFDRLFRNFTSLDEALKNDEISRKAAKKLLRL